MRKKNCFVEEIKEVELRSRRGKFIYNRTYNPVGLNKVNHFFFVKENTDSETFCTMVYFSEFPSIV